MYCFLYRIPGHKYEVFTQHKWRNKQRRDSVATKFGSQQWKKGLYIFVKADPLAATMELQDSEEKLITETHDIQSEFNILFGMVRRNLVSQGVTVKEFVLFFGRKCEAMMTNHSLVQEFQNSMRHQTWLMFLKLLETAAPGSTIHSLNRSKCTVKATRK